MSPKNKALHWVVNIVLYTAAIQGIILVFCYVMPDLFVHKLTFKELLAPFKIGILISSFTSLVTSGTLRHEKNKDLVKVLFFILIFLLISETLVLSHLRSNNSSIINNHLAINIVSSFTSVCTIISVFRFKVIEYQKH